MAVRLVSPKAIGFDRFLPENGQRQIIKILSRSHLKKRILVQVRGGAEFKTAGILKYFEDFKRGTNKEIGPKDFFEIASNTFL